MTATQKPLSACHSAFTFPLCLCVSSLSLPSFHLLLLLQELCRQNIDNWFQTGVWVLLSLSATLVAFQVKCFAFSLPPSLSPPSYSLPVFSSPSMAVSTQVALLVTSLMLRRLVIEAHRRNRVSFIHVRPANTTLDNQPYHKGSWHLTVLREQQSEEFSSPYTFPLLPPSCPCPCHKRVRTQKQVSLDTAHHRPPLCNCNCHKYESE